MATRATVIGFAASVLSERNSCIVAEHNGAVDWPTALGDAACAVAILPRRAAGAAMSPSTAAGTATAVSALFVSLTRAAEGCGGELSRCAEVS